MSKKLKKECFNCGTFDSKQRQHYKCAVPGSCPGRDWSSKRIQKVIKRGRP